MNLLEQDSTLSHYRIVEKLGAGGMGEVWLAEDTRLKRKVALKLLPAELTADAERVRRFEQEAQAASALSHPNIITVYDIGECEAGRFIVMELVAGRTLRAVIAEENALESLLTLGTQMAKALSAAHTAGITHRDIKPDNIMVRDDGYVKVLDFGLARLRPATESDSEAATMAQQTMPGTVMGTVAYMSPEQARGEPVSHPSDIFAFGIVLYELATGRHPFKAETLVGYLHAITLQEPAPLTKWKPELPVALNTLILRMLSKDASQRPTASEVAQTLHEIERRSATAKLQSNEDATVMLPVAPTATSRAEEGFWVAVLPFKWRGANAELEALAEGLSEDIVTGLSRFSYLRVIARGSTLRFTSETSDVRAIGKELGARYVIEGSLRQAGSQLRVAVQLVDANTGAHLWTETYNRSFSPEVIFELQDELVPRIVSTVADWYGALPHSMSEAVRLKTPDQLSPYEAVLRGFGYFERIAPEEHAAVRAGLERAVEQAPGNADGWALLSMIYGEEHRFGFNAQPDPLGRSLAVARRAVDAGHANHFAWLALAQALFFRKEFAAFREAAERAIALNPMDGSTLEYLAHLIAFAGDWERGCDLAEQARQLNPNHPGWYWAVHFLDAYRKGDYETARTCIFKNCMRGGGAQLFEAALLTALYGQLGEREAADKVRQTVLAAKPDFLLTIRSEFAKWYLPELVEQLMDGLRKAGLEITDEEHPADASTALHTSGEKRADEGFWVAVLPFKSTGSAAELAALAEGLSDEIITGLSRFSYLRVIARGSTLRYVNQATDLRVVGKELGARYVMEGSLRQSGTKLRLAVQLVDATTGAHLWAENYERSFSPETVFELQDDLVPRIVSTVADQYGSLVHSMSESLRGKDAGQYSAHEAVLRACGYEERITREEHEEVREILEKAVAGAPGHSDCQALLSKMYWHEYAHRYNVRPDPLGRALAAAQRAVAAAPTSHLAHYTLATVLFFQKDFLAFRAAAERALALNRMDASTTAMLGILIAYAGDWEYGLGEVRRATQLNPHHPGWYHLPVFYSRYRKGDYRSALESALKVNMPGYYWQHVALAAAYGQLGEPERARAALRELHALMPGFGALAREEFGKWFDAELTEHLIDGLRKAGLKIAGEEGAAEALPASASADTLAVPGFAGRPAIAVLPFENRSNDPEQEYFADGLAEDLITRLSLWRTFPVIARNSSFAWKGKMLDLKQVSADLGVRYVVEGSVRKAGNRVRITAQLVDATNGQHVWAKTYDRELTDVFAVQDEISEAIAASLVGDLQRAEYVRAQRRAPESLEAWGLYQRALPLIYRFTREDSAQARVLLEQAIGLDPQFSTALARLAELGVWDVIFAWTDSPQQTLDAAVAQARRAVELDPRDAEARSELAFALMTAGFGAEALEAAQRGLDLNPSMPFALATQAYLLYLTGRPPEVSIELIQRALRLSPHDPTEFAFYEILSGACFNAGRYAEGLVAGRRVVALLPGYYWGYLWSAMNAVRLGQLEEARALIGEARRIMPELSLALVRQAIGAMAPEVDRRFSEALRQAGLEEGLTETEREGGKEGRSKQSASQPVAAPAQSIAVLPFANISADEENEYFCDGLAEELLNALAKIDELKVAARTSAFSFKGKNAEAREIGKTLNVNTVLEGSVRKAGNRIRINVQLVNAADGYQLWSERYDREMKDIFDVQDEITLAVVDALKVKLFGDEKKAVLKKGTENKEAYDLYLKARFFFNKFTAAGFEQAVAFYERAIAIDENYALAYVGISEIYFYRSIPDSPLASFSPKEAIPKIIAAAERAIAIDENLAEAWASLAHIKEKTCDFQGAKEAYRRSFELDANYPLLHSSYGAFLSALGEHDEAIKETQVAREADPFSAITNIMPCFCLYYGRRYDEAIREWELVTERELTFPTAGSFGGLAYVQKKRYQEAIEIFRQAVENSNRSNTALACLGHALAVSGNRAEATKILNELLESSKARYVSSYGIALVQVGLDEKDKAIESLEAAYEEANMEIVFLNVEPRFDSLRDDPRFQDIIRRIGFPANEAQPPAQTQTLIQPTITDSKQTENVLTTPTLKRHTVGRERERNELRAAFITAKDGRGSLLCVAGEPGIGKTTLVEDFLAELSAEHQGTIARGRCSERLAGTEAYLPLLEALESLLQSDKSLASTMKQLAPTWYAQVVPLAGDSEESSRLLNEVKAASQERMKRELASFLQAIATPQPLVLFFDDLHWADVSTIDLLSFLSGKFDAMRVLIVVTYRPSDMLLAKHPFLQIKPDLQARGLCRELSLEFLTEAEIADYLTLEFPRHAFPPDFARLIHAKTEGSPLFMADLVRYLRDRNVIAQTSGAWKLEQTLPGIERELPESVRGMIERKIAQLSEEDRKLLTAASVQGYEFDSAVVAKVLDIDADEVEERLEKLERVFAFVKLTNEAEFPNRTLTLKYRFVHVLYQNALYAALRITRKASLSREVAQTMEGFYGEQRASVANELAALYEAGREYARAAEYYRLAAEHDTRVAAYQEAVVLARRGLGLLKSEPNTTARTRQELALQITLSVPLGACRGLASEESRELFARARELAQQLGDPPELLTIMYGQWRSYLIGGDNNTALKLGEEFLALARAKAPAAMIRAHQIMASVLKYRGEFTSACAHTKELLALWNPQPHAGEAVIYAAENPAMIGLFIGAWSLWNLGYPEQALQQSREALALARQDASPFGLALATFMAAELHISRRETQRVREMAEDCLAICTEHGFPQWLANGYICRGWALVEAGQGAAGVAQMREGITAMHAVGADLQRSRYLALLGEACGATRQFAEGLSLLAEALAFGEQSGERFFEAEIYRLRGELLLKSEAPQTEVEECFHQAIQVAQRQQAKSPELRAVMSLVRLWQQQGQREEARQMLAAIYGWFTEGFDTADLQEAKALLEELH